LAGINAGISFSVAEVVLGCIDKELHSFVIETLTAPRLSTLQRKTLLLKKGLPKSTVDALEVLDGKGSPPSTAKEVSSNTK
jgi:hypothetical protein